MQTPKYTTRSEEGTPDQLGGFFGDPLATCEHPFLSLLLKECNAYILHIEKSSFWVLGNASALVILNEGHVELEILTTPPSERGQGHAKQMMNALLFVSDKTGIKMRLRAAEVVPPMWRPIPPQLWGAEKKGRIPIKSLPDFYQKFGFKPTGEKAVKGTIMERPALLPSPVQHVG